MHEKVISGIRPSFPSLSRSQGQVTHVLLTRSPLEHPQKGAFPHDLHVLSTPPAFVLSQDQTLHQGQTNHPTNRQPKTLKPEKDLAQLKTNENKKPKKGLPAQHKPNKHTLLSSQKTTTHGQPFMEAPPRQPSQPTTASRLVKP